MNAREQLFIDLLAKVEGVDLDFKRKFYDFSPGGTARAEFVKDLVSMYNTPRCNSAYIVFGVQAGTSGRNELLGLSALPDEAELQRKLEGLVSPKPVFVFHPVEHKGKSFAVIEIPVSRHSGPCLPTKDVTKLEKHQLYVRRGSQNSVADADERTRVYEWFLGRSPLDLACMDKPWQRFAADADLLASDNTILLITTRIQRVSSASLSKLGTLPLLLTVDLDPASEKDGLLGCVRSELESRRTVHTLMHGQALTFHTGRSSYWFLARGIDETSADANLSFIEWQRRFDRDLRAKLGGLAKALSRRPVTCIVLLDDEQLVDHVETIVAAASAELGGTVRFLCIAADTSVLRSVERRYEAELFQMTSAEFVAGVAALDLSTGVESDDVLMPTSSGAPVKLDVKDALWVAEDLTLVALGSGTSDPEGRISGRDFLRGGEITWFELFTDYDIRRDMYKDLKDQARRDLAGRGTTRLSLLHEPGAGGTTATRRLAWDLHEDYPCAVLHTCQPDETAERVALLYRLTSQPVLLVVEGDAVSDADYEALYRQLEGRSVPVTMLRVQRRRRDSGASHGRRSFSLATSLTRKEAVALAQKLGDQAPDSREQLQALIGDGPPAFIMALTAFEEDFVDLARHVRARLTSLDETQRGIVLYIAMAFFYGQKGIRGQLFADSLAFPRTRVLNLRDFLPTEACDLLVVDEFAAWRPCHYLVAEEILKQLVAWPADDTSGWRNRLSRAALEFADFLHDGEVEATDEALDLAARVFVSRDSSDLLTTQGNTFAPLLQDIPVSEGRLAVLRRLVELFPDESHFWAHLGRFCAIELRDFDAALEAVDNALQLQGGTDSVLQHMRGMILRNQLYETMGHKAEITDVVEVYERAAHSFAEARSLNPEDDYGYISDVQMAIRLVRYATAPGESPLAAAANSPFEAVRAAVEHAEGLLADLRATRPTDHLSDFEQQCRAQLDELYGDFSEALQKWDNLLAAAEAGRSKAAPERVRRQIVWTYLARCRGGGWVAMPQRDVVRAVTLLEASLTVNQDSRDLKMWIRAVRHVAQPPSLDVAVERVFYWNATAQSVESLYYLYVLRALQLVESGSGASLADTERAIEQCREASRYRRRRTASPEWLGKLPGLRALVDASTLGDWDVGANFFGGTQPLRRIEGRIKRISGPQAGALELDSGLEVFFLPGQSEHSKGRSENMQVSMFLGFSFDGPRAWSVEDVT